MPKFKTPMQRWRRKKDRSRWSVLDWWRRRRAKKAAAKVIAATEPRSTAAFEMLDLPDPVPAPPLELAPVRDELLKLSAEYVGRHERSHSDWIARMNRAAAGCKMDQPCWLPDASPWCGSFMTMLCRRLDLPVPSDPFRASAWINWGRPAKLDDAQRGDVVVLTRPGGNHVGILLEVTKSKVRMRGGNQSDAVTDNYKVSRGRVRYVGTPVKK